MRYTQSRARLGGTRVAQNLARTILSVALLSALSAVQAQETAAEEEAIDEAEAEAAEPAPADAPAAAADATLDQVVVSARKRDELLVDVPVSITAVSGASMERNALRTVADVAPYVPGLNINSDSVGRAFVSIRGIGTALQAGVQPGVGVFQDGVYVRETSYINNPLLDVERIEVLRGPQGTLYGKNTLGGAINIITRPPPREFEGRAYGTYSEGNDNLEFGGRVGGALSDTARARVSFATRDSDGFYINEITGEEADAVSTDQANFTLVWDVLDGAALTTNAYWLDLKGPGTTYSHVDGTTDYRYNLNMNVTARTAITYSGANTKLEFPMGEGTNATAILAYDRRAFESVSDGDFLALDVVRSRGDGDDETYTGELRFDTMHSDTFSTLFGLFASRETADATTIQRVVPQGIEATTFADRTGDTYAVFGTAIWRFAPDWELSAGLRYDMEDREQDISNAISVAPGVVIPSPTLELDSSELQPRFSLTKFYDSGWMGYGSIAKGYRGGGFNAANVPAEFLTYDGDTVWTYELGAKFASPDDLWQLTSAIYYNDYTDFIGQNALARGPGGGLVSIDLNLGDVESYGLETEFVRKLTDNWNLRGNVSLMHARITDQSGWIELTGAPLATDRLLFQPDWTAGLSSDVTFPVGAGHLDWSLGVSAKGSRPGSSFDPVNPSILDSYMVFNTALTYRRDALTIGLFANNMFDEEYFESYIDGSLLAALGLLDQNLGILGSGRNVGVRLQYEF